MEERNLAQWGTHIFFPNQEGAEQPIRSSSNTVSSKKLQLGVYYQNARGLRTKTHNFYCNLLEVDYDIIALSETWLIDGIYNSELFDDRYNVIRSDQNNDKTLGGGILLAFKKTFSLEIVNITLSTNILQCLVVKAKFRKLLFYVVCVYIPPSQNISVYEELLDKIELILIKNVDVLILGDFNCPQFVTKGCDKSIFVDQFMNMNGLTQYNMTLNYKQRLLDLILSNMSVESVTECDYPLVPQDPNHPVLYTLINLENCLNNTKNVIETSYRYDYANGDYHLLYYLLNSANWSVCYLSKNVDDCLNSFYKILIHCINQAIPLKQTKSNNKHRFPKYFSIDLIRKIRRKNRLHKQVQSGKGSTAISNEYKNLRDSIRRQTRYEYTLYQHNLESNININPKSFWSFLGSKNKANGIPTEVSFEDNIFKDTQDIANAFAQFFSSVYAQSSTFNPNSSFGNFSFSRITEENVRLSIKKLKPKKSVGTDNVPSYIFKGCIDVFLKPLSYLFNLSLDTCTFPVLLKQSSITPIFKTGSHNKVENYRPISILNTLAKIFEKILYNDIMLNFGNCFSTRQHGFLPDRSTVSNLCTFTTHAMEAINNKNQLDVIMTDCAKAFDKLDHGVLLSKLGDFGFSCSACLLMQSYLKDWKQSVKLGNCYSQTYLVTSGVPQGSNLGPLLFAIFINDLPDCIKYSESLVFADDFKVFKQIYNISDCAKLQEDLDSVTRWFLNHKMRLNIDKCLVITYTRKINYLSNSYTISDKPLQRQDKCKDLGVNFQMNMKFINHYNYIINKAYRALGFIIRNSKHFKSINTIVRLYNSLVRSHLEYASVIWAPSAESNIDLIERVQKRFLRYLYYQKNNIYPYLVSYKGMLVNFSIQSLEVRRNINLVLFIYFIINSIKYKSCFFINYIHFRVPKINLRLQNTSLFQCDMSNWTPMTAMQQQCNMLINKHNIDLFNVNVNKLKSCFNLY